MNTIQSALIIILYVLHSSEEDDSMVDPNRMDITIIILNCCCGSTVTNKNTDKAKSRARNFHQFRWFSAQINMLLIFDFYHSLSLIEHCSLNVRSWGNVMKIYRYIFVEQSWRGERWISQNKCFYSGPHSNPKLLLSKVESNVRWERVK